MAFVVVACLVALSLGFFAGFIVGIIVAGRWATQTVQRLDEAQGDET